MNFLTYWKKKKFAFVNDGVYGLFENGLFFWAREISTSPQALSKQVFAWASALEREHELETTNSGS